MSNKSIWIFSLVVFFGLVGFAFAQGGAIDWEFPEWYILVLNAVVVPLVVQLVKKFTGVYEVKAILAGILSFITAVVAGIITKEVTFGNIAQLVVWGYGFSQLSYNMFWHRLMQNNQ